MTDDRYDKAVKMTDYTAEMADELREKAKDEAEPWLPLRHAARKAASLIESQAAQIEKLEDALRKADRAFNSLASINSQKPAQVDHCRLQQSYIAVALAADHDTRP